MEVPAKLIIDVKQRGENNEKKKKNSYTTQKSITGFYGKDKPKFLLAVYHVAFTFIFIFLQVQVEWKCVYTNID